MTHATKAFTLLMLAGVLGGCLGPKAAVVRAQDTADAALVAGDHARAEEAYRAAEAEAQTRDAQERARLFALVAKLSAVGADGRDEALSQLRTYSVNAADTPWGQLAALHRDEMAQADALRWALHRAGADISALEKRVAALEEEVAQGQRTQAELTQAQTTLREERAALQRTLREVEELSAARAARIAELEAELEALKSIDMSRSP